MGAIYRDEPCRTALNRVRNMRAFNWSLNPYMGCAHRCTFCFVRAIERIADRPADPRAACPRARGIHPGAGAGLRRRRRCESGGRRRGSAGRSSRERRFGIVAAKRNHRRAQSLTDALSTRPVSGRSACLERSGFGPGARRDESAPNARSRWGAALKRRGGRSSRRRTPAATRPGTRRRGCSRPGSPGGCRARDAPPRSRTRRRSGTARSPAPRAW